MTRTKKEVIDLEEVVTEALKSVKELIAPLELDLNREDLNKVVDKLNEVIKKVNQ